MPVVPNSAYVSMETVTTLIRAVANDMIYSQAGEILTDEANFMLPLLNDALEWFQNEVNNHGVNTFTKETILTPLTPTQNPTDPGQFVGVNDNGYFDTVQLNMGPQLQIPPDLLDPLFLWERQTGSTEDWVEMSQCDGGLPSVLPAQRFRIWEWRTDTLYMPGAVQSNDIRLRYNGSLAMFVSTDDILYFRGATGALAYYMVSSYLASKNPQASQQAESRAKERLSQITTRNARMKMNRENSGRRSYGNPRGGNSFIPPRNS
jgi:hypothetical protein